MTQTISKAAAIKSVIGSTGPLKIADEGPDYTSRSVIRPVAGEGLPQGTWQQEGPDGSFSGFVSPAGNEVGPHAFGNVSFQVVPATPEHGFTLNLYLGDYYSSNGVPAFGTRRVKV